MKRQKSLFTFESFCIILANSFFKNCLTCVKVQFLQQESKQTFPENLKSKKRDYHFQTEVVLPTVPWFGTLGPAFHPFLEPQAPGDLTTER